MGALMRAHDWSQSSLGDPHQWPQSLRTVVRLMLNTGHPMYVFWGADGACLYNDAYRESIGPERHPDSLGRPARGVWEEIWPIIGPQIEQVMAGGGATWNVNALVPITRHGRYEQVYWTYSYSPIDDESAASGIGGVLVVCTETTQQIANARALSEERDRFAQLFAQAPTFMAMLRGPEHRFELVNVGYARLVDHRPVVGRTVAEALPEAVPQGYLTLLDQVYASGEPYAANGAKFAVQARPDGPMAVRYVDFVYQPIRDGEGQVTGIFVEGADVTERTLAHAALHERNEHLQLLDAIGEATRAASDAREIMHATTRLLGQHLGVTRCAYADVEADQDGYTIRDEWTMPGFPSLVGGYSLASFGSHTVSVLRSGEALVIRDVERELGEAEGAASFVAVRVRAVVCMPLVGPEGLRGLMAIHSAEPRDWTSSEIALVRAVAERSWAHIERVRAEALLRANEARFRDMAEKLSLANSQKDEFLATLAHELRNPLAPIRSALDVLNTLPDDDDANVAARAIMNRQLGHLVRLIDDLLDLSRVNRGLVDLRRSRVALRSMLSDAVETSRPQFEQAGVFFESVLPDAALTLDADPTRIVQVFSNLLNNAAKFTPRGGHVRLSVEPEADGQVQIRVSDDGVGIPNEMLERVFDMFAQVNRTHTQVGGGLGIGLSLVRRLVEMHGGRVEASSAGAGSGSEFRVHLPLAESARASQVVPIASPEKHAVPAQHRVLVADDNVDAVESLALLLELKGHQARMAHDGLEALALAREFQPTVMVLDIAMPGLDGHELARAVRAETWGRNVLLIAASGWGQAERKQQSLDAGFDHHLVKPLDFAVLERLLASRALQG